MFFCIGRGNLVWPLPVAAGGEFFQELFCGFSRTSRITEAMTRGRAMIVFMCRASPPISQPSSTATTGLTKACVATRFAG
ncbi:MAG: hypothetical protein LUE09_09775 [Synergistaceae bacterium]|nr:hypothetical protein [Synergistaceae bacterium]